jgi:hypothetical protein
MDNQNEQYDFPVHMIKKKDEMKDCDTQVSQKDLEQGIHQAFTETKKEATGCLRQVSIKEAKKNSLKFLKEN